MMIYTTTMIIEKNNNNYSKDGRKSYMNPPISSNNNENSDVVIDAIATNDVAEATTSTKKTSIVDDDDENDQFIVDVQTKVEEKNQDNQKIVNSNDDDDVVVGGESNDDAKEQKEEEQQKRRQPRLLTREERAMAMERVPPPDIPAWGPTGDIGMDARTKAVNDALEDIHGARERLTLRERKEARALDELSVLRVDATLERKRLTQRNRRVDANYLQDKLRRLDHAIDDASRKLRLARQQTQFAREELDDVEARHWAILSTFNPAQAAEAVQDAFSEFEASEPAVRWTKDQEAK